MLDGVRPSYATGFAQWPGMSEYPHLWRGLVGAWCPPLGMTGSRLLDWSGKGIHGTLVGNTAWVPGKFGPCLSFDGTDDYVDVGANTNNLGISNDLNYTVAVTAKWPSYGAPGDQRPLVSSYFGVSYSLRIVEGADSAHGVVRLVHDDAILSSGVLVAGPWYYIVQTYRGSDHFAEIYIDGVLSNSGTVNDAFLLGTYPVFIGYDNVVKFWNGLINDVMIFNRALSASEIQQLYHLQMRLA